jgi:hypothetical protein
MALGLALGVVVVESGGTTTKLGIAPAAASATPAAASATPAAASATPAATQNASNNADCELIVPARPLTATGLATPYQLTGPGGQDPAASGCTQANPNLRAFVQATILDPATGRLWVYEPLVITAGTNPAVAPVRPRLPKDAVVNLMFGFNGNNLELAGTNGGTLAGTNGGTLAGTNGGTLAGAKCVNGLGDSLFGQVAYCNSVPFYAAASRAIQAGRLRIPKTGRSPLTGQPCPTTRSFQLVDQDPSDDVTTRYLLTRAARRPRTARPTQPCSRGPERSRAARPAATTPCWTPSSCPRWAAARSPRPTCPTPAGPAPPRPWTNSPRPPASGPRSRWSRRTTR